MRLAHIVKEIDALPKQLLMQPSVEIIRKWYVQSFQELLQFPALEELERMSRPAKLESVNEFGSLVKRILDRHAPVVMTMAQGILELKQSTKAKPYELIDPSLQTFLDRFYMSRIGIRMLLAQHLQLYEGSQPGWVGVIDEHCVLSTVMQDAASNAKYLCDQYYLASPEVNVVPNGCEEANFPYVPAHLYHMLFELLKNSLRATVEYHGPDCDELPPVTLQVAKGANDLTIRVSDQGGGIAHKDMVHLFTYLYTTAEPPQLSPDGADLTSMNNAPLAGFGYGLPLSRLYARYFGGDLQVISMDGYGTDAYIYLKVAADESSEVLPMFNRRMAAQHYGSVTNEDHVWKETATNFCNISQSQSPAYVEDAYNVTPATHPEFAAPTPTPTHAS